MPKDSLSTRNGIAPTLEIPDSAPAPSFDLANPDLNFVDLFPENFFSLEGLQVIVDEGGGPLVLTVIGCTVEYVYNPENGESSGSWKPCLSFAEMPTRLVLNKTRARKVMEIAGSPLLSEWAGIGHIAIKPAIKDGHAQIVIEAVSEDGRKNGAASGRTVDDINKELFGE
jgi:hypothetical protein